MIHAPKRRCFREIYEEDFLESNGVKPENYPDDVDFAIFTDEGLVCYKVESDGIHVFVDCGIWYRSAPLTKLQTLLSYNHIEVFKIKKLLGVETIWGTIKNVHEHGNKIIGEISGNWVVLNSNLKIFYISDDHNERLSLDEYVDLFYTRY